MGGAGAFGGGVGVSDSIGPLFATSPQGPMRMPPELPWIGTRVQSTPYFLYGDDPDDGGMNAPYSWNAPKRYVGLVNQAMTCYLNSFLQTLFMTPEFRNIIYKYGFIVLAWHTN